MAVGMQVAKSTQRALKAGFMHSDEAKRPEVQFRICQSL